VSRALVGRAIALAGIVAGLLAIGLALISPETADLSPRYVDDGTIFAFLVTTLAVASYLPAEIGRDEAAAAVGTAAFGFFLHIPAIFAFGDLDLLGAGTWLGVCAGLIPIGALAVWAVERGEHAAAEPSRADPATRNSAAILAIAGLALILAGIWLPADTSDTSYWNLSSSGHALGLLMLLAVALNIVLVAATLFSPSTRSCSWERRRSGWSSSG
jgi:hypothetical protein